MVESRGSKARAQAVGAASEKARRQKYLSKLHQTLTERFSEDELRTLCFHLEDADYDDLEGKGKASKARELVSHLERRHRIPELVESVKEQRPDISWEDISKEAQSTFQSTPTPHEQSRGEFKVDAGVTPAEDGAFTRHTIPDRRRHILDKMTQTVNGLRTYIKRYGQAVDAQRLSIILYEQTPAGPADWESPEDWKGYLKDTRRVYDEATQLAQDMSKWQEICRPEREGGDQTKKLRKEFNSREKGVLALAKQHKNEHDDVQHLISQLRRGLSSDERKKILEDICEQVTIIYSHATEIRTELHHGIEGLITKELATQLSELERPGGG